MNRTLLLATTAALSVVSWQAIAATDQAGANNVALIEQLGPGRHIASIDQTGGTGTQNFGEILQAGTLNEATQTQSGDGLSGMTSQNGVSNVSTVDQFGENSTVEHTQGDAAPANGNTAGTLQDGSGQQATVGQFGMNSLASQLQLGTDNSAYIRQGAGTRAGQALQLQDGTSLIGQIDQDGLNNLASQIQSGADHSASIVQDETTRDNQAFQIQGGSPGLSAAFIEQTGGSRLMFAEQIQDGDGHLAEIFQNGALNSSATQDQGGSGQWAIIYQETGSRDNTASQTQAGTGNFGQIIQAADSRANQATQDQSGTFNVATITQWDGVVGNTVEQTQTGFDNEAVGEQEGNNGTITQVQTGNANFADAWQTVPSAGNTITQTQTTNLAYSAVMQQGSLNVATVFQH